MPDKNHSAQDSMQIAGLAIGRLEAVLQLHVTDFRIKGKGLSVALLLSRPLRLHIFDDTPLEQFSNADVKLSPLYICYSPLSLIPESS